MKFFNLLRVDFIYALTVDDDVYLIPSSVIVAKSQLPLGKKYAEYLMGGLGIGRPSTL